MTYKQIKQAQIENKILYEDKTITKQEYIEMQFELLKEIRIRVDRMEKFDFGILKKLIFSYLNG